MRHLIKWLAENSLGDFYDYTGAFGQDYDASIGLISILNANTCACGGYGMGVRGRQYSAQLERDMARAVAAGVIDWCADLAVTHS
jgi:hypothetical protein